MSSGGLGVCAMAVVAAFWILRQDVLGPAVLGRRWWRRLSATAVIVIALVSQLRPADFTAGFTVVIDAAVRQERKWVDPMIKSIIEGARGPTTTTTSVPEKP